jgi:hypothetical protein
VKTIKKRTEDIHTILSAGQRDEVYRWLQITDPSSLHNRAQKDYEPGTGSWVLRSPEWTNWLTLTTRCLWVHGIPGAGKTILASFLVESAREHCTQLAGTGIAGMVYYYCYFGHNQDEASPFLRWVICQLCRQADCVPDEVYRLYKSGMQPSLTQLLIALETILDKFEVAYIILDAVDESSSRVDILKIIRDLSTDSRFTKIKILVTSREYIDIEEVMVDVSVAMSMSNPLVEEDIRLHIRTLLQSAPKFRHWPKDILAEVEETVSKEAKGMYVK